jgi:hypothetical protein
MEPAMPLPDLASNHEELTKAREAYFDRFSRAFNSTWIDDDAPMPPVPVKPAIDRNDHAWDMVVLAARSSRYP